MHEEWEDVRRSAEASVQLTGADELRVIRGGYGHYYRPYRVTVECSWPGDKIGHGAVTVHILANEVHFSGELHTRTVNLLLSDLDEIPSWLASLVQTAQARCFG